MRRLLPLLAVLAVAPPVSATAPLCSTPALAAPDARALAGDSYVRVAPDGTASWLVHGVRDAGWHGTRGAWWTEPARQGLPSLLCVDGAVAHAGFWTAAPRWSPDGTRVAFGDNGTLKVLTGSAVTSAGAATSFAWSPAGDALVAESGGVVTVRGLVGTVTATLDTDRYVSGVQWSGSRVVYLASDGAGTTNELVSVLPDGTGRTVLGSVWNGYWAEFAYAADGSRVAFADGASVTTSAADGTAAVTVPVAAAKAVAFSPDAATLAYGSIYGGGTVAAAGTATTTVVTEPVEQAGWADGAWFERLLAGNVRDLHAGGASIARGAAGHDLSVVRRDADGSYVVSVARVRGTEPLPTVG
jgi:hypothetical protein